MKKTNNVLIIRDMCVQFCPDLSTVLLHDSQITASTWQANIETGKAVEMLALCALIAAFRSTGYKVSFPELYKTSPDLFYLRNIIPRHHGAQAGHEAVITRELPLYDRFLAALTPKAVIKAQNERCFLIYREGHPIHSMLSLMKHEPEYLERPDFLITEGEIDLNIQNSTVLPFVYRHLDGSIQGSLRIKNDIKIPLISLDCMGLSDISINGIIECSVGKGKDRAENQLNKYLQIFAGNVRPVSVIINGQKKSSLVYDHEIFIDLVAIDINAISQQLIIDLSKFIRDLF